MAEASWRQWPKFTGQGESNLFTLCPYVRKSPHYGTQISPFFTRNWMELLNFRNILKIYIQKCTKKWQKQRPLWAISMINRGLEIWPPIEIMMFFQKLFNKILNRGLNLDPDSNINFSVASNVLDIMWSLSKTYTSQCSKIRNVCLKVFFYLASIPLEFFFKKTLILVFEVWLPKIALFSEF